MHTTDPESPGLDPLALGAAVRESDGVLTYTPMRGQAELPLVPVLAYREQAARWADGFDVAGPWRAAFGVWLRLSGAARAYRRLDQAALEQLSARRRAVYRPGGPRTNFVVVPALAPAGAIDPARALDRAARVCRAIIDLRRDFAAGALAPEVAGGRHHDLSQLGNCFRGFGLWGGRFRLAAPPEQAVFCVFYRGAPFLVGYDEADPPSVRALRAALAAVVAEVGEERSDFALRSVDAAAHRAACAASERLLRANNAIAAARFVVALDLDSAPATAADLGHMSQIGGAANRWYLHAQSAVVHGNGLYALQYAFAAGIDGNIGVRAAAEVIERAGRPEPEGPAIAPALPIARIAVDRLEPQAEQRLAAEAAAIAGGAHRGIHEIAVGERDCLRAGVRPVESFMAALAVAAARAPEERCRFVPLFQMVSQGRYRLGSLNVCPLTGPALVRFTRAMHDALAGDRLRPGVDTAHLAELYRAAAGEIAGRTRASRTSMSTLDLMWLVRGPARLALMLLLGLRALLSGGRRRHLRLAICSYVSKNERVHAVGRPRSRPGGRQLWIHYQILDGATRVVPNLSGPGLREEDLVARLTAAWRAILSLSAEGVEAVRSPGETLPPGLRSTDRGAS